MHDVAAGVADAARLPRRRACTTKPILVYPYDVAGLLDILDAASHRGRRRRRCASGRLSSAPRCPTRRWSRPTTTWTSCWRAPSMRCRSSTIRIPRWAATARASIPGTLVLANADWLAGLTMHQLKRPGAPFCSAGFTELLMDMRTTLWSYGAPEMLTAYAAVADLAHWYGMPAWGLEMLSRHAAAQRPGRRGVGPDRACGACSATSSWSTTPASWAPARSAPPSPASWPTSRSPMPASASPPARLRSRRPGRDGRLDRRGRARGRLPDAPGTPWRLPDVLVSEASSTEAASTPRPFCRPRAERRA